MIAGAHAECTVQYHQKANPVLRRAVSLMTTIRDDHFAIARQAVTGRAMKPAPPDGRCC